MFFGSFKCPDFFSIEVVDFLGSRKWNYGKRFEIDITYYKVLMSRLDAGVLGAATLHNVTLTPCFKDTQSEGIQNGSPSPRDSLSISAMQSESREVCPKFATLIIVCQSFSSDTSLQFTYDMGWWFCFRSGGGWADRQGLKAIFLLCLESDQSTHSCSLCLHLIRSKANAKHTKGRKCPGWS